MNKTILIVDDEDMLRMGLVRAFELKGFEVFNASNAKDALALVNDKSKNIDLVISDICMPEEDGVTLLEKIRLNHPDIPVVIFITGFSDYTHDDCVARGAKTVFAKPFKIKDLVQSVMESLEEKMLKAQ